MVSNSNTRALYHQLMEETGFYINGAPTSGIIEAEVLRNDNQQLGKRLKYSAVIDPDQINATAVFELSGSPCIYFAQLDSEPDPRYLAHLHKLCWNHGLAPMLWVVTPTSIRLYNCYAKPVKDNPDHNKSILIKLFESTDAGLKQLVKHAGRLQLESGEFWKWQNARQIDRKKRVDRVLVEDLRATEKKLRTQGLESHAAHSLLMRAIFVAYLEDRGILNSQFFLSQFGFDSFVDLLSNISATNNLFEWLRITFNGDMFSVSSEDTEPSYEAHHLNIVRALVCGKTEIETGQGRLWRYYDFKVIPVELISSIYENFLYSKDIKSAKELSVHYTPINLVDLVLDEVFKYLNGNSKIVDLSCGSGVFLVESFRRLVVKRWVNGEEQSRQVIRDTLYNQVFGVDVEPEAIQIAAFSLYLTALELDYELDHNTPVSSDLKFRELIGRNLFPSNAFDEKAEFNFTQPFSNREFDAVVGNPPWTQSKANRLAQEYCKRKRPDEGYPDGYPIARQDNPDQAFLWRISDFSSESTKIGLLLHGKPFFSQTPKARKAKEAILKRFRPIVIVNLSKLREEWIFPASRAPTLMLVAECRSIEPNDFCYLVSPDRLFDFNRHGIIEIAPENIKRLSSYTVATDPDILKVASWAGARDLCLIQKLRTEFSCIKDVAGKPLSNGFKRGVGKKVPEALLLQKCLFSGEMSKYQVDLSNLGLLFDVQMEATREVGAYEPPLVIISQTPDKMGVHSAFSEEMVVYTQKYSGVSLSHMADNLANYINGVINSSLISYFLFLTAASWGVERDEVTLQDLSRIPIPTPSSDNENLVSEIIAIEKKLRVGRPDEEQALVSDLNEAVFDLFDLDQTERILVEDGVNLNVDLLMSRESSVALKRPISDELKKYSNQLIEVIKPFLKALQERVLVADVIEVGISPLQVVKFSFVPAPGRENAVEILQVQELRTVLASIAKQLPSQIADQIYTRRNLRIYNEQDIYIVKPAQKRYWSRSAALNDADLIISEHLKVNRASIG